MHEFSSQRREGPVLVIGAAGIDLVGRVRSALKLGTSNPAHIRTTYGGVARNIAENLARLGQPVTLISAVGMDQAGDQLIEQAQQAGVNVEHVLRTAHHPTGHYLGVIGPSGDLQVGIDDLRAAACIKSEDLRKRAALFEEASLLFLDANLPKETLRTAFSLARRAQLPVCADPTSLDLAEKFTPYLDGLFMLTPNVAETAFYCGEARLSGRKQIQDAARRLVALGVEICVIIVADQGVYYATAETNGFVPAMRAHTVDPTGAGDALSAAMLFSLLNDIPLDDAVRLGVAAASLTLGHRGAVLPDLTLEKLYDQLAA